MAIPTIRVTPEILYSSSEDVSSVGGRISSAVSELSSVLDGIRGAYEGQLEAAVGARVASAQGAGNGTANRIGELSADLVRRASAFETADNAALGSVLGISTMMADLPTQDSKIGSWVDLHKLPLGSLLLFLTGLVFAGPLAGLGQLLVNRIPALGGLMGWNGTTFPNLRWPWDKTGNLISPPPKPGQVMPPSKDGKSGFGKILEREEQKQIDKKQSQKPADTVNGIDPRAGLSDVRSKLDNNTLMQSPWKQIDAPLKNSPEKRSPNSYREVIDQFDVEHSYTGRYRPSDAYPDTRCNVYAGDVSRAMGAPLPTKGDLGHGASGSEKTDPMTANAIDLNKWLNTQQNGWHRIDLAKPQDVSFLLEHLKEGKPALASDPGHIAVLRPDQLPDQLSKSNLADLHIAQAGKYNLNDVRLGNAGYGTRFNPDFFIHD